MPIYLAHADQDVTIVGITGSDKIKNHLANLGFVVGETVRIINIVDENLIIKVKGVSMALSHDMAKRIMV